MNSPLQARVCNAFWSSLLSVAIAVIGVIGAVGCAGPRAAPPERDPLAGAPDWVTSGCRVHWQDRKTEASVICGIGSAGPDRNPLAARETAVARARSAIARSIEVTIESVVRLESGDHAANDGVLRSIVHQLTSTSLPACRVETVWLAGTGEVFALVSLRVSKLQQSLRRNPDLSPAAREDLAQRAASAFAAMNAALDAETDDPERGRRRGNVE
jgi:hypothetical protein